jgi:hypothetical protein
MLVLWLPLTWLLLRLLLQMWPWSKLLLPLKLHPQNPNMLQVWLP